MASGRQAAEDDMLYSAFTVLLKEHPLEWWPIGKIYILKCQWLLFKEIFLFIFSWVWLKKILVHLEPEGKNRGGNWGPSCGYPWEGKLLNSFRTSHSQPVSTKNERYKYTDPHANKQVMQGCFMETIFLHRYCWRIIREGNELCALYAAF